MRYPRASPEARAGRKGKTRSLADLGEREGVEFQQYLALEPRLVALARMLARPAAITALQRFVSRKQRRGESD